MKKINIAISIAISLIGLMACNKNNNTAPKSLVTIAGQVVKSCDDHTPVAGLELFIAGDKSGFLGCKPKRISTITDAEGRFTISYDIKKDLCTDGPLELAYENSTGTSIVSLIENIPASTQKLSDEEVKQEIFFMNNNHLWNFRIKTSQPYTEKDTIKIRKYDGVDIFDVWDNFPGPFTDGELIHTIILDLPGQTYGEKEWVGLHSMYIHGESFSTEGKPYILKNSPTRYNCNIPNEVILELPE